MRTDGPRVTVLSAIGVPVAIVAARYLPDASGYHHGMRFVVACAVAAGLSAVVWLAVSSRLVDRATWLATAVGGLAAFGLSLSVRHENLTETMLAGIFWSLAGVLSILAGSQALRAIQRARHAIRHAPYGQGARGTESRR